MPNDRPAVLFDVDGTLVDTNWFHTLAWWRSCQQAGVDIPMSRIHPLIGMGSDKLLNALVGEERSELKDGHSREFERLMDEIHAFPKASEVLREVDRRGGRVVLCTSAKKDHLEPMLEAFDADDAIDAIVDADDVEQSKPSPDVFTAGLEKLDLDPKRCLVVGDTVWDVEAANQLGVACVSVLTGGATREQLKDAGAAAVYEDVADLLDHLDESPVGQLIGG